MAAYRPSVQPYLISQFTIDPAVEFAKVAVPALVAQGTTDLQVTFQDAQRLGQANSISQVAIIDGMNHVLKIVPNQRSQQIASYGDPSLPIAPALIEALRSFLTRHFSAQGR